MHISSNLKDKTLWDSTSRGCCPSAGKCITQVVKQNDSPWEVANIPLPSTLPGRAWDDLPPWEQLPAACDTIPKRHHPRMSWRPSPATTTPTNLHLASSLYFQPSFNTPPPTHTHTYIFTLQPWPRFSLIVVIMPSQTVRPRINWRFISSAPAEIVAAPTSPHNSTSKSAPLPLPLRNPHEPHRPIPS